MKKLVTLGLAALLFSGAAQSQALFVNIHSGSAMTQGVGLVLAGHALEQRAYVRILLCDAAGDLAVTAQSGPKRKPHNAALQKMLQGVIQAGAQVEVCALYLLKTGLDITDLLDGVTRAKPADVADFLLQPGVNSLSF